MCLDFFAGLYRFTICQLSEFSVCFSSHSLALETQHHVHAQRVAAKTTPDHPQTMKCKKHLSHSITKTSFHLENSLMVYVHVSDVSLSRLPILIRVL